MVGLWPSLGVWQLLASAMWGLVIVPLAFLWGSLGTGLAPTPLLSAVGLTAQGHLQGAWCHSAHWEQLNRPGPRPGACGRRPPVS